MRRHVGLLLAVISLCAGGLWATSAGGEDKPKAVTHGPKKVLVELYTSQGCDSCPPASKLLGQLRSLGYGPDKIVPIGFHVDYFNDPWPDPYSDPAFSRRQLEYNEVLKRNDLYFTPLLMVDGSVPMLGSNRPMALQSIERALKGSAGCSISATIAGDGGSKTLSVEISRPSAEAEGRSVIVGVAMTEGPLKTRVPSGENGGKTLVEYFVARGFAYQNGRLDRAEPLRLTFPLTLKARQDPSATRLAVFVQDQIRGTVYQADSLSWSVLKPAR